MPCTDPQSDKTTQILEVADPNNGKRLKVKVWNVPLPDAKIGAKIQLLDVSTNPMKGSREGGINVSSPQQIMVCIWYFIVYSFT